MGHSRPDFQQDFTSPQYLNITVDISKISLAGLSPALAEFSNSFNIKRMIYLATPSKRYVLVTLHKHVDGDHSASLAAEAVADTQFIKFRLLLSLILLRE